MTAAITLKTILEELVEREGIGMVVPIDAASTTTTLTQDDAGSSDLRGPFSGARIPVGSPVIVLSETAGTTLTGNTTYVSNWNTGAGVLTVSPAIASDTDATTIIIVTEKGIENANRLIECVNRALANRIGRWEMRPLTFVPDGDLQGTTVTDYWTATGGTPTYQSAQTFPAGSAADTYGQVGINRILQFATSSGTNNLQSNSIGVPLNASGAGQQWYFQVPVRAVTGSSGTAAIQVRDVTNSAAITVNVIRGSDSNTHSTASREFVMMEGTFTVPEDCTLIAFRLVGSATSLTIQMGPLVAYPQHAFSFPFPNRVTNEDDIGNFYEAVTYNSPGGLPSVSMGEPLTMSGREHWFTDYGDHMMVSFNFRPARAVWYEEWVTGAAITAMASTTTFDLDRVVLWSAAELYKLLYRNEKRNRPRDENGRPMPSVWKTAATEALRAARATDPRIKQISGRR